MLEIIEKTRELAKSIQETDEYKAFMKVKVETEENDEINGFINEINLIRINQARENEKPENDRDKDKLKKYEQDIESVNQKILNHDIIISYNKHREVLDNLMNHIYRIFIHAVNGGDVDSYNDEFINNKKGGCSSGGCGGCGGGCSK